MLTQVKPLEAIQRVAAQDHCTKFRGSGQQPTELISGSANVDANQCQEAVALIPDGASIMIGGFMGVGGPDRLLDELARAEKNRLTVIANDACLPGKGIGKLVDGEQIARLTASHIGLNPKAQQQMMAGKMAVD